MEPKYKAITIFLFILGILITIVMVTNGTSIYQRSRGEIESNMQPAIDCTSYIYQINKITQEGSVLSFNFENMGYSDRLITNLTVRSDINQSRTIQRIIPQGTQIRVKFEGISPEKNFTVSPTGCEIFSKTCILSTGECQGYQPGKETEN